MDIIITKPALEWFKTEMRATKGDYIRFFVRYGGCGTVQQGFSLGLEKKEPLDIGISQEYEGITFFMEREDLWYLNKQTLVVDHNEAIDELIFRTEGES